MNGMILCMYSGGLDSAAMLHLLLTKDEYKAFAIHVHHLHLVNLENRALATHAATLNALEHLRKSGCREFGYSESLHRYPVFNQQMLWDADLCAFMAGNICNATPDIRYVALGRTKTDTEHGGPEYQARLDRALGIFRAVKALNQAPSEFVFPVAHLTKGEIWELLPPELRAHTWSCRRPVYVEGKRAYACGQCFNCKAMGIAPPVFKPAPAAPDSPAAPAP